MISPSADDARALTQAAVVALLCHRYHDLATWASEALKQRIHFLARPDGSNLADLYVWDSSSPQHLTRQQIFDFLHEHWSPDHLPLAPPEGAMAWEAAPVYRKRLDQETIQVLVPIGRMASDSTHEEASLLAVVLCAEQHTQKEDESAGAWKRGEYELCWKYHNVVSIQRRDLAAQQWELMSNSCHIPINMTSTKSRIDTAQEEMKDDGDSDDDYWGQYGDEDSLSDEEEEASTQHSCKRAEEGVDEDDEDEYWRKYAKQQEKEDAAEMKRKMELDDGNIPEASIAPTKSAPLPRQVDSTMLSSLLQMLVQEGIQQVAAEEIQDTSSAPVEPIPTISATEREQDESEEPTTATTGTAYIETPTVCTQSTVEEDPVPPQAKAMVSITLEAAVRQAALGGLSKEQVFALLENVYQSRS